MPAKSKKLKNAQNTNAELTYLTKEQLKVELKIRGAKTSGSRNELIKRLGTVMATVKRKSDFVSYSNGQMEHKSIPTVDNMAARRQEEREEREKITLWLHPLTTLQYSAKHVTFLCSQAIRKLLLHKKMVAGSAVLLMLITLVLTVNGPHQAVLVPLRKEFFWCLYWLGLGVLSSVGLGTGLHTFVLYLGPHIASVTLAAYECNSLNFPEPPYPDEIICPENDTESGVISILQVMSKVRVEAMMWGAGTALGELPPYFMARAARKAGYDPDDEDDLREFEELQLKKDNPSDMSLIDRAKLYVERMVEKLGFVAILACASIPNPLFDLAGITCGHFLVPFWTFFGATLLGKAVIKMHIQKLFVIIAFNESLLAQAVSVIGLVPVLGPKFQQPLKDFLEKQKQKLHRKSGADISEGGNILGWLFEKLVIVMILYFLVSIVNSMAQSHHKRLCKERRLPKIAKD